MLLAGCTNDTPQPADPAAVPLSPVPPTPSILPSNPLSPPPSPSSAAPGTTRPSRSPAATASTGWEITVYYTAVEKLHDGRPEQVTGCRKIDCAHGDEDLGEYPEDFVDAVEEEGTGRTEAGRYLNWSYDIGYWLDTAPRDTNGHALHPFVSAAADPGVLARGTRFRIAGCGTADDGSRPAARVCTALRNAAWQVTDEFTPGLGGSHHIDAYIGEETGRDFTGSPWYLTLRNATLAVTRP